MDDTFPEVPAADPPAAADPVVATRPRRVRRWLAVGVAATVALGALGTGIAVAVDEHDKHVKQERIAAEKRAAAAYVTAVRPLAARVFDAVQPVQDVIDGMAHLRPGLAEATRDVITRSGAREELASVGGALQALKTPTTYRAAAVSLVAGVNDLASAVKELDHAVRTRPSASSPCASCAGIDHLNSAEASWALALGDLNPNPPLSSPSEGGGVRYGPARATRGGFIEASDLACALGGVGTYLLPHRTVVDRMKDLPAVAKVLRTTIASLRAIHLPASRHALKHILDIELQSVTALATSMDELYAAYVARNVDGYKAVLVLWDQEQQALRTLASTYRDQGVSDCATFFDIPAEKNSKPLLTA